MAIDWYRIRVISDVTLINSNKQIQRFIWLHITLDGNIFIYLTLHQASIRCAHKRQRAMTIEFEFPYFQ